MQRRTTIWFLLLFQPILVYSQNHSDPYECKIGSVNPLAATSPNACFKLYNTPKSYQAARRYCVSLGGQLADKINKDDSSLYSANADLEVTNGTQFWVGASNLKCNIAWENGGEIEFNEMWAPDSRYYGVAIDKMSLGGLWHTIPVGHKLPFVCTFQGKSKDAPAPVHAMRAPAKKRAGKEEKAKEDDIDESLNAAQADERKKKEESSKKESKKDEDEIDESMNAALSDEKKASAAMATSDKKSSSKNDEQSDSEEASMSAEQKAQAGMSASMSASSKKSTSDESSNETYDSAEIAMRKEIGKTVVAMKSQEMASQSEDYDKYTEEDLMSAAASLIGGYTVNANWADSRTTNTSSFDSQTDEESMSMSMTVADQMAMAMQSSNKRESENSSSDSTSDSSSDQMSEQAAIGMSAAMKANSKSSKKSSSEDESEDSASMSMAMKAEDSAKIAAASKSEKKSEKSDQEESVEEADVASAANIFGKGNKKPETPKSKPTGTTEDPDINESLNAALANQRSSTTNTPDLSTVLTTVIPENAIVVAAKPSEKLPGCPAEWTQFNTNSTAPALCFRRYEKSMNFEDARLFCVGKGGHLASIHNEKQLLLLSALLHNNGPDALSDQTWIGLNRIHQKYYVYEDETAMDFTRWLPGAPNINDCTVFTGNELPNYPHKGTQYKFGDFPCEEAQKSVLCEVTLGKDKTKTQPTCQEGWSYYSHDGTAKNGKCYKRVDESKKFSEAREVCKHENSFVASVQNEGEARFVSALVQTEKNYTVDEQTWIGYVKYDKDFGWEDGNKGLQFDPWTEKMPREKKCVVFTGNEIHEDCRSRFRFVSVDCSKPQRSILCSKPPIKDGVPFIFKDTENTLKKV